MLKFWASQRGAGTEVYCPEEMQNPRDNEILDNPQLLHLNISFYSGKITPKKIFFVFSDCFFSFFVNFSTKIIKKLTKKHYYLVNVPAFYIRSDIIFVWYFQKIQNIANVYFLPKNNHRIDFRCHTMSRVRALNFFFFLFSNIDFTNDKASIMPKNRLKFWNSSR